MTTALSPILVSPLEKAATDNGFDQVLEPEGDWIVVASTQCPLRVWLGAFGDAAFLAALSQQNVACVLRGGNGEVEFRASSLFPLFPPVEASGLFHGLAPAAPCGWKHGAAGHISSTRRR